MARNNRKAFTLVEMLVVITIIAMLMALLVPAVIGARARARRVTCMNRMNQAGKAILQYEAAKGYLPGYVNSIGRRSAAVNNLSWVVVTLQYMERADLWKEWRTGNRVSVNLPAVICPSDVSNRAEDGALSFVVNCGISDFRLDDSSADVETYSVDPPPSGYDPYNSSCWGLFYFHDEASLSTVDPVTIGLDEIDDGATETLLLSENLQATNWASRTDGGRIRQSDVGFVWWAKGIQTQDAGAAPSITDFDTFKTAVENGDASINSLSSSGRFAARPSSHHPLGANVVFADGHSDFISERVDYEVYRDQMIPSQTDAWRLIVP